MYANRNGTKPATDITPIYSEEAEQSALGSAIIDREALAMLADILKPEHFWDVRHQYIYEAMMSLFGRGSPVDLLSLSDELRLRGHLDEAGGEPYIAALCCVVPTALHVRHYAEIVYRDWQRRTALRIAQEIAKAAYEGHNDLPTYAADRLSVLTTGERQVISLSDALVCCVADYDAAGERLPGVPTGLSALDRILGGLCPGRLTVIAGKPGAGKTTLMLQMALTAARSGSPVIIVSCEMSEPEVCRTLLSRHAGISLSPADVLALDERTRAEQRRRLMDAADQIAMMPIAIEYRPGISVSQLRHLLRHHSLRGAKLAVVDYIQLVDGRTRRDQSREQEVAEVALTLKTLAGQLGLSIVAGSQVNDAGEVRESRAIEQHADALVVLERADVSDVLNPPPVRTIEVQIRKNRHGAVGKLQLGFCPAKASFAEVFDAS
jgi:replicative DNA helicase